MSTNSTVAIYQALTSTIQTFIPFGVTASLSSSYFANNIYVVQAPDNQNTNTIAYPYLVIRLINRSTDGAYNGDRETADFEVMVYARPRNNQIQAETIADGIDGAMLRYRNPDTTGIIFSRERQRDTIIASSAPQDRELVTIRLVYPLVIWPRYLTQYSGSI